MIDYSIQVLFTLMIIFMSGYVFSILKERLDFNRAKVYFKSSKVTQNLIDQYDLAIFKLGGLRLNIGDEVKIILNNEEQLRGFIIGARKKKNAVALVTEFDEIVELNIRQIRKLKIVTKYGRIF